jgi:hypothetical protein
VTTEELTSPRQIRGHLLNGEARRCGTAETLLKVPRYWVALIAQKSLNSGTRLKVDVWGLAARASIADIM